MKCTDLVISDHSILRRGLDILEGMIKKLEAGERIEIAAVAAVLKFLRGFGDEYHQTMEEKVLFPALLRTASQDGVLPQILLEHSEERALVAGIEEALRSKRGVEFVRGSRRLLVLLGDHLNKEDAFFRELPESLLSREQDNSVVAEFTANRVQPETYANLSRLEWKYAPKPQPLRPSSGFARAHPA